MPPHDTHQPIEHVEPASDRSFGLIVGGVLVAVSTYLFVQNWPFYPWIGIPGLLLVGFGIAWPRALRPLNVAWTRLSLLLGRIVTPVVMGLVFFATVLPIGLILRALGKNPLSLKKSPGAPSYWILREPPGPAPDSLRDQF